MYLCLSLSLCVCVLLIMCVCLCIIFFYHLSYSYDLTHTLQYNMSPCKGINSETLPQSPETELKFWNTWNKDSHIHDSGCHHQDIEDASAAVRNFLDKVGRERKNSSDSDKSTSPDSDNASASKSSFLNGKS